MPLQAPSIPTGVAFSLSDHQTLARYWRSWRLAGVAVRIATDHAAYEELIEICPGGVGTDPRGLVYLEPGGTVVVDDVAGGLGMTTRHASLEAALQFLGAEMEADLHEKAGAAPCQGVA